MALSFQKVSDKRLKKRSPWTGLALRKLLGPKASLKFSGVVSQINPLQLNQFTK
jgi:hypothetical protein